MLPLVAVLVAEEPAPAPAADVAASMRVQSSADEEALRRSQLHERWYGWQTLSVDALAVGGLLFAGALGGREVPLVTASAGIYALGPPVVHLAHGHPWKGLASLGLRVGAPALGYALGRAAGGDASGAAFAGAFLGGMGATATDAAFLAWDRWQGVSMGASF
jgi:hypothetical protein